MIDLMDLVTWLRAQLNDVERVAESCHYKLWDADGSSVHAGHPTHPVASWVYDPGGAEHIALHDPWSVLADVAAKRRILDELEREQATTNNAEAYGLWRAVQFLGEGYAHRPGYREEWRP